MRDDRTLLPTTGPTLGGRVDEPAFWKRTANPTPGQTHRGASHETPPIHSDRGPTRRHDRAAHSATQGRHVVTPGTDASSRLAPMAPMGTDVMVASTFGRALRKVMEMRRISVNLELLRSTGVSGYDQSAG